MVQHEFLQCLCTGAVLVFMPGLAEIKMLYEQLQSNRMFNNRGRSRSVCWYWCSGSKINLPTMLLAALFYDCVFVIFKASHAIRVY